MSEPPATITVRDDGGHLAVEIHRYGRWELLATYPTHRGAQVPEARTEGLREAREAASALVERYRRIYDLTVI